MSRFTLNVILALIWAIFNGHMTWGNLFLGFLLGYLILYAARSVAGTSPYFRGREFSIRLAAALRKTVTLVQFAFFFLRELFVSNINLAIDVLTRKDRMKPRIIGVRLDVTADGQITALANLISLTPGTLSLDVSTDKKTLYIHFLYAEDRERAVRGIKNGMERWIKEIFPEGKELET
jgi:multicomponent Na+:H+ antiporter subunit E